MNPRFLRIAFLTLLVAAGARPAAAGENTWTKKGPDGGSVLTIAIDPARPDTMYAGTVGGLYRTEDGGGHWTRTGRRLDKGSVSRIELSPGNPAVLYAGTSLGLFRSDDRGKGWNRLGLSGGVSSFAVDPRRPGTLYAVHQQSVWKTSDGGNVWDRAGDGIVGSAFAVVLDPVNPSTLYALSSAGPSRRLFKSTDGATSWRRVPDLPLCGVPTSMIVGPSNPGRVYVGCAGGVVRSVNGGETWVAASGALAGLYIRALAFGPDGEDLYAITHAGVFRSRDGATTWRPFLNDRAAQTVAGVPGDPERVYVGTANSLLQTRDGGLTWDLAVSGIPEVPVYRIAADPALSSTAFAATANGLFRTTDGGEQWTPSGSGIDVPSVFAVAFDPADASVLYAAGQSDSNASVYTSEDAGATWRPLANLSAYLLEVHPRSRTTLYAAHFGGLAKSTDGGKEWRDVWVDEYMERGISAVSLDPRNSGYDFATANGELLRSPSGEDSWSPYRLPARDESQIIAWTVIRDPGDPGRVYVPATTRPLIQPAGPSVAGPSVGRMYETVDGGENWIFKDMPAFVSSIVIDPTAPTTFYAATYGGDVFRSRDGGTTWEPFRVGLDASYLRTLAVDRSGRTLFAGGAGIFTLRPSACLPAREDCSTAGEVVTYLPVVAGVQGAAGVRYSTSVRLENASESPMSVSLEFFPSSTGGLSTASIVKNVEIPPERDILIEDVVTAFFEAEGLGAVRLKSSRRVISTGEIALDGVPSAALIVPGVESAGCARGRIPLRENAEAAGGASRANLGYFNPNPFPVSLALGVEREDGSTAGGVDLQIPGHSQVQYPLFDLLQTIPLEDRRLSSLSIRYESNAPVLLYGVVVDSATGDGTYLAGRCD